MYLWFGCERAPYKLLYAIICVECGAEECGANFHAVASRAAFGKAVCAFPVKRTRTCFPFVDHCNAFVMAQPFVPICRIAAERFWKLYWFCHPADYASVTIISAMIQSQARNYNSTCLYIQK